jgi:predicted RNA methylase
VPGTARRAVRQLRSGAGSALRFVVYFTKGLADVVEAEVSELVPAAEATARGDRFLIIGADARDADLVGSRARTVDDVRLLVAGPASVATARDFDALCAAAADATERAIASPGEEWSVTMSVRNPAWRAEPRWDPAPIIARRLRGADPAATVRRGTDLRIQGDGDTGHIAVSLFQTPVGKQHAAPTAAWPGALRPTVAASLVRLCLAHAEPAAAARGVYDPFCGSGSIAAAAAVAGLPVFASDIAEAAVALTRERLGALFAGTGPAGNDAGALLRRVFVHDVRRGPDPRVTARLLVTNMPWGKQVKVDGRLALFDAASALAAHVTRPGGVAVLLTTHEDQLVPRLRRHGLTAEARRIGLLGQTPAIVIARPG